MLGRQPSQPYPVCRVTGRGDYPGGRHVETYEAKQSTALPLSIHGAAEPCLGSLVKPARLARGRTNYIDSVSTADGDSTAMPPRISALALITF